MLAYLSWPQQDREERGPLSSNSSTENSRQAFQRFAVVKAVAAATRRVECDTKCPCGRALEHFLQDAGV
jgi:hypothetical protein